MRMTRLGVSLVASLGVCVAVGSAASAASKKKAPAGGGAVPAASTSELQKLKGEFKWGMTPNEVTDKVIERLEASFAERLKKTANDPARQDRVRKEMRADSEKAKKNYVEFKGQKSGWDVSIIDQEFSQSGGESMLFAKEESSTRYFFFDDGRLYKMFIAFDKDMLQGKSFEEFGQLMQARFGRAREVRVEEKTKTGTRTKLDHYEWGSKAGDGLRLVDRSEFYDVFCLVLFDSGVASRLAERQRKNQGGPRSNALVEAATATTVNDRDPNDNVVDRVTGREHKKPGEGQTGANIAVPSPTTPEVRGPTPEEINRREPSEDSEANAGKKGKGGKGKLKNARPPGTEGLEL
jgi:hypothetical protein